MKYILLILLLASLALAETKENKTMKYFAGISGLFVAFEEGAEQGYFFQGENSHWQGYTKANAHLHWGARRAAMVGTGLLISQWHPRQKFLSWRTANQYVSYWFLYSWAMNRGLRLVQTGKPFPPEKGHAWYIDMGFLRVEVKAQDWMQWGILGIGAVGMALDAIFD